jgi:phage gp29-like protein|nr:hypothetical protein [uncultured Undibacterium sp.]
MPISQIRQIAEKNESANKIATSLQQFVDEVEKSSQNAIDFARLTMNAQATRSGQQRGKLHCKVNCVLTANIVQCGTR